MKRRNPLPRRQLAREPAASERMMGIARSVPKDEPGGLELRATLVAEALKMRRLELANPSPLAGEGGLRSRSDEGAHRPVRRKG
jgi:hypothetical protein